MKQNIHVSPESRQYNASFPPIGLHDTYYIFMKSVLRPQIQGVLRPQKQGGQEISKPEPQ